MVIDTVSTMNRRLVGWTALVTALFFGLANDLQATEKLVLSTPELTADTVVSEMILKEAYRRIGINVTIKKFPPERSLHEANNGKVDGEVQRIGSISEIYHNLRRVDPTINFLEGITFTANADAVINSWPDLKPFRVGILRGIKFVEANTKGLKVYAAGNHREMFRMLNKGRFDVVVAPRFSANFFIRANKLESIRELPKPLVRLDLFHYLHKRHEALVPRVSATLQAMSDAGELIAIRKHVMARQLDQAEKGAPFCNAEDGCMTLPAKPD